MASFDRSQGLKVLQSDKFSDFTITCRDKVFRVHKAILFPKSKFFEVCVDGKFEETQQANLTISEADPTVVALMICYIYTSEFSVDMVEEVWPGLDTEREMAKYQDPAEHDIRVVELSCQLYELSMRLMIPDLQSTTAQRIVSNVNKEWWLFVDYEELLARILISVYMHTVPGDTQLRGAMLKHCLRHRRTFESQSSIMDIIREHDAYAWDVGVTAQEEAAEEMKHGQDRMGDSQYNAFAVPRGYGHVSPVYGSGAAAAGFGYGYGAPSWINGHPNRS